VRIAAWCALGTGVVALVAIVALLRLASVTDYVYHALVKDPERRPPEGRVVVAPADGTVLYVRRIADGVVPEVVKRGVPVPIVEHAKSTSPGAFGDGWLVGIYMNTQGVHVNRMPDHGTIVRRIVWNGPHMDMTRAETRIILREMVPGLVTLRKLLGLAPHGLGDEADFVTKSARETLVIEDARGLPMYVVRIGDYWVGKILTWVAEGQKVPRGERIGMISWGSQTDLFVSDSPGLEIAVGVGDYLYGGETVVATY
jgi:phosphatidylserine decarboxylase